MVLLFGTTSCMFVPRGVFDNGISFSTDFRESAGEGFPEREASRNG